MDNTTKRQREYKKRMYNAGFKQTIVWVKRKEERQPVKLSFTEFVKKLRKLTNGMDEEKLNKLLNMFIKITKSKKEEEKLKKN